VIFDFKKKENHLSTRIKTFFERILPIPFSSFISKLLSSFTLNALSDSPSIFLKINLLKRSLEEEKQILSNKLIKITNDHTCLNSANYQFASAAWQLLADRTEMQKQKAIKHYK